MSNQVFISYSHKDAKWLEKLRKYLSPVEAQYSIAFWDDTKIQAGEVWKETIAHALDSAKVAILLVSQDFLSSAFIKNHELPRLLEAASTKGVTILWIALTASTVKDSDLFKYQAANDPKKPLANLSKAALENELVQIYETIKKAAIEFTIPAKAEPAPVTKAERQAEAPASGVQPVPMANWEREGDAVPLDSPFYIRRDADEELYQAIRNREANVRVKGVRQVGKTSLLSRGLELARGLGAKVVVTDFSSLDESDFESLSSLFFGLANQLANQLELDTPPPPSLKTTEKPKNDFGNYMRKVVLGQQEDWIVWALDQVDNVFIYPYKDSFFALLRVWINARANEPRGPWKRLTTLISYSTEPNMLLENILESPFNVGNKIPLGDFTRDQVKRLNMLYGSPLQDENEIEEYYRLVGGHPLLVRQGLHKMGKHIAMAGNRNCLSLFKAEGYLGDQPFGPYLRHLLKLIEKRAEVCKSLVGLLNNQPLPDVTTFHLLHNAGVIVGDTIEKARIRCELYAEYFKLHLAKTGR